MSDDLKALQARAAERAAKREAEAQAREVQALTLEERFEKELGPMGVAFAIVRTLQGPVVVKRGPAVLFKRLRDVPKGMPSLDDIEAFVKPNVVFPEAAVFNALIEDHAGILVACSDELVSLYRAQALDTQGK